MARRRNSRRRGPFSHLGELFDASALGFVTSLLLGASFFATWRGMRDFIIGNDLASGLASQGLVVAIVLALTLAMYVTLREMIAPYYVNGIWPAIWKRAVALPLYVLLAVWSIGFGYGFWWSIIAGQGVTDTELTRSVTSLREQTSDIRSRIAAAGSVMASAEALSDQKARNEAERGGTCGVASPPGDGPLARARGETQSQIAAISAIVQGDWLPSITARLDTLDADLESVRGAPRDGDLAARKAAFDRVYTSARLSAREISTDAAARGRSLATQLRAKASQLSGPPENGRVRYCYDPDLAASLTAAADEIDQPFEVVVPDFRFSEGPEGVARAVEDLWGFVLAPVGIDVAGAHNGPPNGRSLIALVATIGVDFALLVFALLRGRDFGQPNAEADRAILPEHVGIETPERLPQQQQKAIQDQSRKTSVRQRLKDSIADNTHEYDDNVRDAEFDEIEPSKALSRTYEPESQLSDEEALSDMLRHVEELMRAMRTSRSATEKSKLQMHLDDVLRQLKRYGYLQAGVADEHVEAGLHEIVGKEQSLKPPGCILRVVRPRFVDQNGKTILPALVVVSSD